MIRKNNEGFTLVELLVTLGVMAIVMAQIAALMIGCQNLYKKGSGEVNLQAESQRVIQVMEELLVDASVSVNTIPGSAPSPGMTVSSDMINITTSANGVSVNYLVYLDKAEDEEFGELHLQSTINGTTQPDEILAEYVESVSLNMANYATADRVTLELAMNNGDYNYNCLSCKDIYLRNEIGSGGTKVAKSNEQTDYTIEVLRRKEYNLYDLCNLNTSDGWTFQFEDEANAKLYYDITNIKKVHCTNTLNINTGYKDDVAFILKASAPGFEDKTIKLKTVPVRVGISKDGKSKGCGLIYGNTKTSTPVYSYIDIRGISVGTKDDTGATSYDKVKFKFSCPSGVDQVGTYSTEYEISGKGNTSKKFNQIGVKPSGTECRLDGGGTLEVHDPENCLVFYCEKFQDGDSPAFVNMFKSKGTIKCEITISYGGDSANDLKVECFLVPIASGEDLGLTSAIESMITY